MVRILHLEAGHVNHFLSCWHIDTLLKGTERVLGVSIKQKLPFTVDILRRMFTLVDLSCRLDGLVLWLFSPFFGILISWLRVWFLLFTVYTCVAEMLFSPDGVPLSVRWSKTFQYRHRTLHVPLPRVLGSPLCPSQALILSVRLCNSPPWAPLFTYPTRSGWLPLTGRVFQSILITYLSTLGINA